MPVPVGCGHHHGVLEAQGIQRQRYGEAADAFETAGVTECSWMK